MKQRIQFLAWCLFAFVTFKYMRHPIHDGDTWWHLANGRYMLDNHVFLRSDVFSHTLQGTPWINFEWLSEIFMAGLVKQFGIPGLFAAKVLLGMTAVIFLILMLRAAGARGINLLILSWIGYHLMQVRLCTRVELASLNLIPLLVILVLLIPELDARRQKWMPAVFFGVMVVWCNLHAGFLYGLLMLASFCVGARIAKWPTASVATLDRALLYSLVGMLVNPYGPRLVEPFLQHLVDFRNTSGLIAEWDRPTLASAPLFWALSVVGVSLILLSVLRKKTSTYFWIPVCILTILLGFSTARNIPLVAFSILPLASTHLSWLEKPRFHIGLGICFLAVSLWMEKDYFLKKLPPGLIDGYSAPIPACQFVRANNIQGTMFNSYGFGGPIAWELGPERKIFIDGRYIFYPLLVELENLRQGKAGGFTSQAWQDYFSKYGVDYAIIKHEPEGLLNLMFPSARWALVYKDPGALVFVKRESKFNSLLTTDQSLPKRSQLRS